MDAASVRQALERILASSDFDASARNRRFLNHIVEEALAGRADRLKGLAIAIDVFERDPATFDPEHDPVVRIEAAKLRRSLGHYYLTAGREDPVRIDLPKGAYVPTFSEQDADRADLFPAPPADGEAGLAAPGRSGDRRAGWRSPPAAGLAIGLGAVLAVVAAATWLWLAQAPEGAGAAADLPLQGPAVIITPFEDLSGTEAGRLLAGGITQELITHLMQFRDLRVYAASSSEPSSEDVGQQLEASYEVKGSMLRAPDQIRLAVQLLEVGSGRYVWSEIYDRPLTTESIFDLQEQLAAELAGRLAEPYGIVHKVSTELFRRHRPQSLAGYECVLQTFAYRRTFRPELYRPSRDCLEDTVRRDPSYPEAWALLAYAYLDEYRWYGLGPLHAQPAALQQALAAAQSAKELDPDSATGLSAYAAVQYYRGDFAEAESAQRRAADLNPNNPEALAQLGWRLAFVRDWDEGVGLVRQATQRSMIGSGWYYMILAFDAYRRRDYPGALAAMRKAGDLGFFAGPMIVAISQAQLGRVEAARQALDRAVALDPTFAENPRAALRLHHVPESLIEQFMDGLRKAGLDDRST